MRSLEIFCCYAHEDRPHLNTLRKTLRPLERQGLIDVWTDTDISPGVNYEEEINRHLDTAHIVLLLVSPDFIDSDYCYGKEMQRAMERHECGEVCVIPIILRPALWEMTPFSKLQALPTDAKPALGLGWYNQDEAFLDIAKGILKVVVKLATKSATAANEEANKPAHSTETVIKSASVSNERERGVGKAVKNILDRLLAGIYVKALCPFCVQEFYIGDCEIVSSRTKGKILTSPPRGFALINARLHPEPIMGVKYIKELAYRVCPHCKNILPHNIELVNKNVHIAVFGNSQSAGASSYIASLTYQLQEGRQHQIDENARLVCLTPEIEVENIEDVLDLLFEDKRLIKATRSVSSLARPLIYELTIQKSPSYRAQRINLILHDISSIEDHVTQLRAISNADGIIFLIDPMTIPGIFERLPHHLRPTSFTASPRTSITSVLQRIINTVKQYRMLPALSPISVPIAITLSKSDLLEHMKEMDEHFAFLHNPKYNLQDLQKVSAEVRDIIARFEGRLLLFTDSELRNVSFFAISATGSEPDENGAYPFIKPLRCLDPLLWLIQQLGIIDVNDIT